MDHIERHPGSSLPHIEVPYVCEHLLMCSAADFLNWAGRLEWWIWMESQSLEEYAARPQSWLYFSLLCAFLRRDILRRDILRNSTADSNARVLDSCYVQGLLGEVEWSEGVVPRDENPIEVQSNRRDGAMRVLKCTYEAMNRFVLTILL
jgi:hypothetical protein